MSSRANILSFWLRPFSLIAVALVMLGLTACSEEPDIEERSASVSEAPQDQQPKQLTGADAFVQPQPSGEYAAAWPYGFDHSARAIGSTVFALGDVALGLDGMLKIEPTPAYDALGEPIESNWSYELTPVLLGRSDRTEKLDAPRRAVHNPSNITFEYGETTEVVYEHRHDGIKLFVHLDERPAGEGAVEAVFRQRGEGLQLEARDDKMIASHHGMEAFRWTGLIAFDADDQSLPVMMTVEDDLLRFQVDDTDAEYPITIDPLATSPSWTVSGSPQQDSNFGHALATGNVNGSSHTDILVTQTRYSTTDKTNRGRALLFLGSSDGPSNQAELTIVGQDAQEFFGTSARMESDFSDDGCHELIVGAPNHNNNTGRVLLYNPYDCNASDPELNAVPLWSASGTEEGESFGQAIATGDFNCNGNPDLLVGAPDRGGLPPDGGVDIFYGDSSAVELIEHEEEREQLNPTGSPSWFGRAIETIPELDGRDYSTNSRCDSFAISDPLHAAGETLGHGTVFIYGHDENGELQEEDPIFGTVAGARFGSSLRTTDSPLSTEENGHLLSSLIVGAYSADVPGHVYIYEDSNGTMESIWDDDGESQTGNRFGLGLAGNLDLSGNGHYDLVIGAPFYSVNDDDESGAVFVYLGTEDGLQDDAHLIFESDQAESEFGNAVTGIRNFGDETDALLVGARKYDGAGRVFLYPDRKTCYIDEEFYSEGEEKPGEPCQICDPNADEADPDDIGAWVYENEGTICESATGGCLTHRCNDSGSCEPDPNSGDCESSNPCVVLKCESDSCVIDDDATELLAGDPCEDDDLEDQSCTDLVCNGDPDDPKCIEEYDDDSDECFIDGSCFADQDEDEGLNPGNSCQWCDLDDQGPTSWSDNDGPPGSCDNGVFCSVNDFCDGGECKTGETRECDAIDCEEAECDFSLSSCVSTGESICNEVPGDEAGECTTVPCEDDDQCQNYEVNEGRCFIDETCYAEGDRNPANECEVCDPDTDPDDWSTGARDGFSCDPGGGSTDCHVCSDGTCEASSDGEHCAIDDDCYGEGVRNPDNQCESCDPGEDDEAWTDRDLDCSDDDGQCSVGECNPDDGECHAVGDPDKEDDPCDDGNACTSGETCNADGECTGGSSITCDDGNSCTANQCDPDSGCNHPSAPANGNSCSISDGLECTSGVCSGGDCGAELDSGWCLIDGGCVEDGESNPDNECEICDAAEDDGDWSPAVDGESCASDSDLDCAVGQCSAGVCEDVADEGCLIDGECVDESAENDDNKCEVCDSSQTSSDWSTLADGEPCDPDKDQACTSGECADGQCEAQIDEGCLIDDQCVEEDAQNPDNSCEVCDPAQATDAWSTQSGASCELGDDLDCATGLCTDDGCEAQIVEGCLIDGECIDEDAQNPDALCEICDPGEDDREWTSLGAGEVCSDPFCSDDNEVTLSASCDDSGACPAAETEECGAYLCDEGACLDTCDDDDDCFDDAFCADDGECITEPRAPVADAGADQEVNDDDEVTLDGTQSYDPDGNELSYDWVQIGGTEVELDDPNTAAPTFIAPRAEPIDDELQLEFELIVDDGELTSEPDQTSVFVTNEGNQAPVAVLEGPQEALAGEQIILDASESWDPDGDPILDYQWSHVSGQPTASIGQRPEPFEVSVTFPADLDEETTYVIGLIVNDGWANSALTEHEIVVDPAPIHPGDTGPTEDDTGIPDVGPHDAGPIDIDIGIPDAGPDDDDALDGDLSGSGCLCSSTSGGDTQGMIVFALLLAVALWRRQRTPSPRRNG